MKKKIKPSWKNTVHTYTWLGHISKMKEIAEKLGYPYFLWNERVYETSTENDAGYIAYGNRFLTIEEYRVLQEASLVRLKGLKEIDNA